MPDATTPVGVVPLLGSVIEVCQHFPCALCLVIVSRQKQDSELDQHDVGLEFLVALLQCSLLSKVDFHRRNVHYSQLVQTVPSRDRPSPAIYLSPTFRHQGWIVHEQGKFSCNGWSSKVTGIGLNAVMLLSLVYDFLRCRLLFGVVIFRLAKCGVRTTLARCSKRVVVVLYLKFCLLYKLARCCAF